MVKNPLCYIYLRTNNNISPLYWTLNCFHSLLFIFHPHFSEKGLLSIIWVEWIYNAISAVDGSNWGLLDYGSSIPSPQCKTWLIYVFTVLRRINKINYQIRMKKYNPKIKKEMFFLNRRSHSSVILKYHSSTC